MDKKLVLGLAVLILLLGLVFFASDSGYGPSTCTLSKPLGTMHFDCYVINMPGDRKRMKGFMKTYTKCDLAKTHSLIRHEAVVGKKIPLAEYTTSKSLCEILRAERSGFRRKHYELTRGGVGCWLSHRNLWANILKTDKECALIFEDDCFMARNIHDLLMDARIPKDWDICLLGHICTDCRPMRCADTLSVKRFFGLHCYMINSKGIRKILANPKMSSITKQIDSVLSDMIRDGELNVYALPEPVAWQNNRDYATTIQMTLKEVEGEDIWE